MFYIYPSVFNKFHGCNLFFLRQNENFSDKIEIKSSVVDTSQDDPCILELNFFFECSEIIYK